MLSKVSLLQNSSFQENAKTKVYALEDFLGVQLTLFEVTSQNLMKGSMKLSIPILILIFLPKKETQCDNNIDTKYVNFKFKLVSSNVANAGINLTRLYNET